jgi:hypothetical protein
VAKTEFPPKGFLPDSELKKIMDDYGKKITREEEKAKLKRLLEESAKLELKKATDPILPPPVEAIARQFAKEYGGTWQDYVKDAEVATRGLVRNNFYPIDPSALVAEGMIDLWMQKDEAKARIHIIGRIADKMILAMKQAYHAYI